MTFSGFKLKPSLTAEEMILAAHLYHNRGVPQQLICEILGCSNIARINEAIKAIEKACEMGDGGYRERGKQQIRDMISEIQDGAGR